MIDIAPEMKKKVLDEFRHNIRTDKELLSLYQKASSGTITYPEASRFGELAGDALAKAFKKISGEDLPDGKMYYNIAQRVVGEPMTQLDAMVSYTANRATENVNSAAGLNIKVIQPTNRQDKIAGIVNRLASEDSFEEVKWILQEPIRVFSMSVIDDFIKANAEFAGAAGAKAKIIRVSEANCCPWCSELDGEYEYPDVPKDVYRRHDNCRCTVDYYPGDGWKQNVHTKEWS